MVGVVSAVVAGAALMALGVFLKRRRGSKQKTGQAPSVHPGDDDHNLEQGHDQPREDVRPPTSAVRAVGAEAGTSPSHGRNESRHRHTPAEEPPAYEDIASPHRHTGVEANAVITGGIVPPSASAPFDGGGGANAAASASEYGGAGLADEEDAPVGSEGKSRTAISSIATTSTANMLRAEREELSQFRQRQRAADAARVAGEPKPEGEASGGGGGTEAFPVTSGQSSASDLRLRQAVLVAAQELAASCQIPGISEAARAVCIMVNLFSDSRENDRASTSRLRQCRSMVFVLTRADEVVGKVSRQHAALSTAWFCVPRT